VLHFKVLACVLEMKQNARHVAGIPGALTAVSGVQQLCKLLSSRVELTRSAASLALGYLSFDPEARRRLLNWCVSRFVHLECEMRAI